MITSAPSVDRTHVTAHSSGSYQLSVFDVLHQLTPKHILVDLYGTRGFLLQEDEDDEEQQSN